MRRLQLLEANAGQLLMTTALIVYVAATMLLAVPFWHVGRTLKQPSWVRVVLTLGWPVVIWTAIRRRVVLGHW